MRITINSERLERFGLTTERVKWERSCAGAIEQLSRLLPTAAGAKPDAYGLWLFELLHIGVRPDPYDDADHVRCVVNAAAKAYSHFVVEHTSGFERVRTGPKSSERVYRKGYLLWYDHYRDALLLSLLANDTDSMDNLARWLDDEVVFSDGTWNATEEDNLFQKLLAKAMREGSRVADDDRVSQILSGRSRQAKLMLAIWSAIEAGDPSVASASLTTLVEYHRSKFERQRLKSHPVYAVDVDASIMFHLAARRGVDLEVLTGASEYLMTMESLGGAV